jgi:mannosyltransferase OCH1-like enzyme
MSVKLLAIVLFIVILIIVLIISMIGKKTIDSMYLIDPDVNIYTRENLNMNDRVVLSSTTVPSRLPYLNSIINQMYNKQIFRADNFYINVPYVSKRTGEKYNDRLLDKIDTKGGWVIINRCEDIGPATKLLPTSEHEDADNTIIITVDDDQIYDPSVIGLLVNYGNLNKNCAISTKSMTYDLQKSQCTKELEDDDLNVTFLEGFGCILYRRRFIKPDWWTLMRTQSEECFLSDDLTFSTLLRASGVRLLRLCVNKEMREDENTIDSYDGLKRANRKEVYNICNMEMREYETSLSEMPAIIHTIYYGWEGPKLPHDFNICFRNLKNVNPNYNVVLHPGEKMNKLISELNEKDLLKVYNSVPERIMQVDIARLIILYLYGGFYFDLDIKPYMCMDYAKIPNRKVILFTEKEEKDNIRIANYAIGSTKGHPFIKLCLKIIVDRLSQPIPNNTNRNNYVIWATGPDVLSFATYLVLPEYTMQDLSKDRERYRSYIDTIDEQDLYVLSEKSSNIIFKHEAKGTWRK